MYLAPVAFESVNWRAKLISKTSKRTFLPLPPTVLTLLILATVLLSGSSCGTKPALPPPADLVSFSALAPIDAHVHLYKDDPAFGDRKSTCLNSSHIPLSRMPS